MPEMNPDYVLTLLIGLAATACQIGFSLSTTRFRLLLLSLAAGIGFLFQYLLLAQWVGFFSGLIGIIYTALLALGYRYKVLQSSGLMLAAAAGYLLVFVTVSDFSAFTPFQAIPLVAGIASLVALRSQNVMFTKAVFVAAGVLWLTYELYNGMYTQTIGETFELVGNAATLWLLVRASRATRAGLHTMPVHIIPQAQQQRLDTALIQVLDAEAQLAETSFAKLTSPADKQNATAAV